MKRERPMNNKKLIDYGDRELNNLLPYYVGEKQNILKALNTFGARLPEKIVDLSMGKSVCSECGAVYVGKQEACTQIVDKHTLGWSTKKHGYNPLKESKADSWGSIQPIKNFREECRAHCRWDLYEEFTYQKSYFDFLLAAYNNYSLTTAFAKMFSTDQGFNLAQLSVLGTEIQMINLNRNQQDDFNRQVVEKMSNAGGSLYWNGR